MHRHWLKSVLYQSTKHRAQLKPSAKLYYVRPFTGLLSSFFVLIESEISVQASWQVATDWKPNKGLRYYNFSVDENPQREDEMDSSSFKGFHTQLDCKPMYGNKN